MVVSVRLMELNGHLGRFDGTNLILNSIQGVHIVMNILYAIPLVIVAFSVHLYECSGSMAFIQLNAVGILSGVIFAVMETRRPWPVVRSLGPFYLYEVGITVWLGNTWHFCNNITEFFCKIFCKI